MSAPVRGSRCMGVAVGVARSLRLVSGVSTRRRAAAGHGVESGRAAVPSAVASETRVCPRSY